MANQSAMHTNVVNVRAAGSKDDATGLRLGGIYFPEHIKKDNKRVSAHWEGQFFVNQLGWTDAEGVFHEPKNLPIRITAWNGRNATDGKGLADIFAKCVSVGKELSAVLRIDYYQKRLFISNVAQTDHTGQPILIPTYGWLIKSDLQWGSDSANVIAQEIANWQGQANFFSRPPMWNVQNTPDNEAWKTVVATRMSTPYLGETSYGYAKVMIPEGAQIVNKAGQPITPTNTIGATTTVGATTTTIPAPPANTAIPAPPTGPTYEQLIQAGWSAQQIATQAEYAHLKPAVVGALPTTAASEMGGTPLSNPAGI